MYSSPFYGGTPALALVGDRLFMLHIGPFESEPEGDSNVHSSEYIPH